MLQKNRPGPQFVVHELEADGQGQPLTEKQLWEALTRTFQSSRYQPPLLPPVAMELIAAPPPEGADVERLAGLLEEDRPLAGPVRKLCNSPLYRAGEPTRSLRAAFVRLTPAELRDVVMEACLRARVFKITGYSEAVDRVRLHSAAVAHVARAITRFTAFEAEHAFLCGLLHDVGYSAALVALGDAPAGEKLRPVTDLWPALCALHETVGGSVATLWKLPAEIAMVIRLHHTMKVGEVVHPLAAIVVLAEALVQQYGFGLVPAARRVAGHKVPSLLFGAHRFDEPDPAQLLTARTALGLTSPLFERVQAAAAKVLQAVKVT